MQKTSNLGQKLLYLGTFRLQSSKNCCYSAKNTLHKYFSAEILIIIVLFEITFLELVEYQIFLQK